MKRLFIHLIALLMALGFSGCGATIKTHIRSDVSREVIVRPSRELDEIRLRGRSKRVRPSDTARELELWAGSNPERLASAAVIICNQARAQKSRVAKAGLALMSARLAWDSLMGSNVVPSHWKGYERTSRTLATYNAASTILINSLADYITKGQPVILKTPTGPATIRIRYPSTGGGGPGYFDRLIPARRIDVDGFRSRASQEGIGVALVGIRDRTPEREEEMKVQPPTRGIVEGLTGVAEFPQKSTAIIRLIDPTYHNSLDVKGSKVPLAADFTAPMALSFGGINDLLLGIRNMLNVSAGEEVAGVYLTESFDPKRIPVLLIHGFSSSPIVWRNVVSQAMRDPEIRKNYQFWYAFYATGAPVMQSAAMILDDIEEIRRRYDPSGQSRASRRMVIVGYSMGGTIAQILSTDIGDRFWKEIADVPFEQVKLEDTDRKTIRKWLFWNPVPGLDRVIFIATPHKGTRMADASFAQWGRRLIRLPGGIIELQKRFYKALKDVLKGDAPVFDKVTGIDGLSSRSPIYSALEDAPFAPGVRIHSIIGDRGRGDSPASSDGVVGYWSSHLPLAESEVIVPTGHDAQASPLSEAEINRILLDNLGPAQGMQSSTTGK